MAKDFLTSEQISKRFNSSFELVKYAVKLAKNMIHSGRGTRVATAIQNRAFQVLLEIAEHKDQFDDIVTENEERVMDAPQLEDVLKKAQERKRHGFNY